MSKQTSRKTKLLQILVPLLALALLVLFNLIRDPRFFNIEMRPNGVLSGNIISTLNEGSALAILAMGMTLVTAACKGQDISVGAVGAIAGSVLVKVLQSGEVTIWSILLALFFSILVSMAVGAFNGGLVAIFRIQPMIATLIMFNMGRQIAYWINGPKTPIVSSSLFGSIGGFIPGIPIPTPIFIVAVVALIFWLVLKRTTLGLYVQSVGINQEAARLNGINSAWIKLLTFMILGICCAIAGTINVARLGSIQHDRILLGIEMDAILAVAIGGNSLGGGKFNMVSSVIGAYAIQFLRITLLAMRIEPNEIDAYRAAVIIIIVVAGSPVVKRAAAKLYSKLFKQKKKKPLAVKGES